MKYKLTKDDDSEFGFIDQDGVSHRNPMEWLWTEILGGCGCGSSEDFAERAWKLLERFATPHDERTGNIYDEEANEILAHWLDSKKLIEHGAGIGGSWLSEEGKEVYEQIKQFK